MLKKFLIVAPCLFHSVIRPSCLSCLQRQRQEALGASPKAKPFPRAQHTGPPTILPHHSPARPARPASAPPVGWGAGPGRAQQGSAVAPQLLHEQGEGEGQEEHGVAYWERFGLGPGNDFDAFLARQEKFVQASLAAAV